MGMIDAFAALTAVDGFCYMGEPDWNPDLAGLEVHEVFVPPRVCVGMDARSPLFAQPVSDSYVIFAGVGRRVRREKIRLAFPESRRPSFDPVEGFSIEKMEVLGLDLGGSINDSDADVDAGLLADYPALKNLVSEASPMHRKKKNKRRPNK